MSICAPGEGSSLVEGRNGFACVREKRAAPSAPRSGPPAATLPPPPPPPPPPRPPPPRHSRQCPSGPAGAASASTTGVCGRARGDGPGPGGTWFVRDPGTGGRRPLDRPTGGGGRAPIRPEENFATALYLLMEWCVKSPRTDGVADDRTRWPKRRWGNIALTAARAPRAE